MPLVFLHGFGLNRRAYVRLLSRLGGLGFLIIAPDAAGHGETPGLPRGAAALGHRVQLTLRTLNALGVRKAVFLGAELTLYLRVVAGALARNARAPLGLSGALRAIIGSGDFTPILAAMRRHRLPTVVVHGEKDGVVPFESAHDMAERADAALYRVPDAHHSWMLANPRQATDMMRQLLDAELGRALRTAADHERIRDAADAWQEAMLRVDSPLREHPEPEVLGCEEPRSVDLERLRCGPPPPRRATRRRLGRLGRRWARPVLSVPTRAAG